MFALTIDQRGSRAQADRVPELLDALEGIVTALPFERTTGDEVQGVLDDPDAVIHALEQTLRSSGWSIGLGIGGVERPLPGSARAARGAALLRAREAVERAKKASTVHLAVVGGSDGSEADLEGLLRLIGTVVQRRTPAQWRVIDAVRAVGDRAAAAAQLNITVQAISKSLLTSHEDVVCDVYPLAARLLTEADERSCE